MPGRHVLGPSLPETATSPLNRGDSAADITDAKGHLLVRKHGNGYPTVFHIYAEHQPGDSTEIQRKIFSVACDKLREMQCQPPAHFSGPHVHFSHYRTESTFTKFWHSLTGRFETSTSPQASVVCAPQLWRKSIPDLFSETNGYLEACEYLPGPLARVVKLPRLLNAVFRMLHNKQALETQGIFRLAAPNDAAAMNRWFDWIDCSNNNVPEYGAIPNLSPLDFAVLLKRWMSSLGEEDRLVPTVYSQAIHVLMDQHTANLQPTTNQHLVKDALRCILQCLDVERLSVLVCILYVVQAVISHSSVNSMDGENLAKMLAPSMFAFAHVRSTDAYDWAIVALTVMFAERDVGWWFQPISSDLLAPLRTK